MVNTGLGHLWKEAVLLAVWGTMPWVDCPVGWETLFPDDVCENWEFLESAMRCSVECHIPSEYGPMQWIDPSPS